MNYIFPVDAPAGTKGRFAALSPDKVRGGYYTPDALCEWLSRWAVRNASDTIFEPSCGAGAFVVAAAQRLRDLGAKPKAAGGQVLGVELIENEAAATRVRLKATLGVAANASVVNDDLFAWLDANPGKRFDVVVGNPPFIRYQTFPEPARSRAMAFMEARGFRPNRLTNAWVPFVVAAVDALRPGGRLAMVVPAELLQVTYAAQLREYLTERFRHIEIVACNELFFDGAEQEVVLVMAYDALPERVPGNACRVAVLEVPTVAGLLRTDPEEVLAGAEEKDVRGDKEKWLKYLLSAREIGLLRELRGHDRVVDMGTLADVDVGIVTGNNEFFVLRGEDASRRRIKRWTRRLVSRSAHLRGAIVSDADWRALDAADERVRLLEFAPGKDGTLPAAAITYVEEGEAKGVHLGYKCSIRKPWHKVPAVWTPDAFLFRQIHDFPRMVLNNAAATSTDTIHRVRARGVEIRTLVAGVFSSLTAASAEIEGRSYGGGVLELEPTEAERLLVPDAVAMSAAMPLEEIDRLVRAGRLVDVLAENDRLVLREALGLSAGDCEILKGAWDRMRGRRYARGKSARGRKA